MKTNREPQPTVCWKSLVDGDAAAWRQFVSQTSPIIAAAIHRTLVVHQGHADAQDVADLIQDVFLRLIRQDYRALRAYHPSKASLSTWLTVTSRNLTTDHLRRQSIRPTTAPGPTPTTHPSEVAVSHGNNPLAHANSGVAPLAPEAARTATADEPSAGKPTLAHELLTPRQRLVLHLLYEEECTVKETARRLHVKEQSVRSAHHKAMKRLRAYYRDRKSPVDGTNSLESLKTLFSSLKPRPSNLPS